MSDVGFQLHLVRSARDLADTARLFEAYASALGR
jgi:hypothetical protein